MSHQLSRFELMVEEVARNASAVEQNTAAAKKSASDASTSAREAATRATDAAGSARAASTSAGQAASSAQSASSSAGTASTKATEASKSAAAAESSKSAAATSAGAAKTSEMNAAASQKSAATSASTATTKASEAATSARDASASKEAAKSSETSAASSASSAASSATATANSAKAAKTSETNAKSSETAAGQSASAAAGSKTAAASSASAASTSAGQASASASAAGKSAESAASSASTATTKAGEATEQASAAARSASAAKTSETNAKASETSAESSKTAAASSASSAASSASSASASKDEATRQASAAKGSATTASTKATEAAGSATAAAQSKSTAESAATRAETAAKRAEDIASAVALEDASTTKKGIVQLSSATNSTSETLAATPKAVKSAYDNAEKRLQKDQNGADIPDKGRFLNNINAVSKTDFADKRGMRYVRVNAPAGATSGKYYPVVVMRSAGSVSELASRVIITTAMRTGGDPMNNCEFNGFVMPGGWTDRGRYAYGMFWQYQNNERAIHSIMMSNKDDDLRSVFYVDGAAFPVFAFIEDGLSISAPGADLVVNDTTYKFGATNPATECIAADVILDFKSGRGYYCSHPFISSLSGNAATATKLQTARSIGGVVFDGSANINLPGVNTTGNQNTTGNAATATKLQTARNINGVPFDGTKDITLTPKDLDAYSKSEVQSALAGKQPLDNTLTNLSGKDVAGLLTYLGLGDASGYVGRLLKIQVFTASGTVTKTPGAKKWRIKCLGAGGGSSAAPATGSNEVSVSNGGGAGAYAEGIYDVSSITTELVVIGSGGAGGTADSIYGADGGASSVGSFISSPGGKAGLPAGPANPPFQPVANTNSDGPNGWNIVGSSGAGAEPAVAVTHIYATGSRGSNSIFGVGGSIPAINSPANPGGGYGSGASGCSNGPSQSAKSGAAGRPGIVIIEELA